MLNALAYPVSGIMKLWHLFFHSLLGIDQSHTWIFTILGLVITVRGLLVPFFWYQYKSGRFLALMLPIKHQLEEQVKEKMDPRAAYVQRVVTKQLHEKYKYRPGIGCIPPLIQIPAFLGLYRVIVLVARPREGVIGEHHAVGFLSSDDVSSFLSSRISEIPLPAYRMMAPRLLEALGTSRADVGHFVLPILLFAVSFTTLNMGLSIYRSLQQFNYDSKSTVVATRILIATLIVLPIFLLTLAWFGPLPVAVIVYWFANNLWTLTQQAVLYILLSIKYPLSEEFKRFKAQRRAAFQDRRAAARRRTWRRRRLQTQRILTPWRRAEMIAELRSEKERRQAEKLAAKEQKKALSKVKAAGYQLAKAREAQAKGTQLKKGQAGRPTASGQKTTPTSVPTGAVSAGKKKTTAPRHLSEHHGIYRDNYQPRHQAKHRSTRRHRRQRHGR